MPTDATGTPTSLGIPTFNVDVDEPSGLGFNEAMAIIDSLLVARASLTSGTQQVFSGSISAPQFVATLSGHSAGFVGGTLSGPPVSGTWSTGAFVVDYSGAIWVCTAGGTPGTWKSVGSLVNTVFGRTGSVVATSGDYTAAQVTNAADLSSGLAQVFNGRLQTSSDVVTALTGHTAGFGGGTTSGAPTTGTWGVGEFVIDYTGSIWICTAAGSPGTWKSVNTVASVFGRTGVVTPQTGDYTAAQVTNAADKASASIQTFTAPVEPPNVLYPVATAVTNTFTPIVDQSGVVEASVGGLSGVVVTVNNPGHFPASGMMALFSVTLTVPTGNSVTGVSWGNAYKFGLHASNVALNAGQSYTWTFVMDGTSNKAVCVGDSGVY